MEHGRCSTVRSRISAWHCCCHPSIYGLQRSMAAYYQTAILGRLMGDKHTLTSHPSGRAKSRAPLNSSVRPHMSSVTANEVAAAWIEKWNAAKPSLLARELDLDWDIPRSNPELCLQSILEILAKIPAEPANRHFQVLAGGPLEDLLVNHGPAFVERIGVLAQLSPAGFLSSLAQALPLGRHLQSRTLWPRSRARRFHEEVEVHRDTDRFGPQAD